MQVYVINHNGNPLMPSKPAKARKLLRDGKATVVHRCPFTIQLLWDCEEHVQNVVVALIREAVKLASAARGKGRYCCRPGSCIAWM